MGHWHRGNVEYRRSRHWSRFNVQNRSTGYKRESGPPDPVCLSFTHDRDYGIFKAGNADNAQRSWDVQLSVAFPQIKMDTISISWVRVEWLFSPLDGP